MNNLTPLQQYILTRLSQDAELYSTKIGGETMVILSGVRVEVADVKPLLDAGLVEAIRQENGDWQYNITAAGIDILE